MTLKREEIELLAPVGSYESLMAAIQGGANAVYFGVGRLNMRSMSTNNFTIDDLNKILTICHENNIKTYVTVNSVMYDEDLVELETTLKACKEANIDAIIASDVAVIQKARNLGLNVHLSTQLNISNIEALKFYARYAEVVVLARELNLTQVRRIFESIVNENIIGPSGKPIKIEMFVHGALCMAISGKCYLSLHEYNHSANRGECFQVCRRSYIVTDKETGSQLEIDNEYIMSPKDLCTIEFLDQIIEAGARVLKIEGRARAPEYVKVVSECYNEAIKAILEKKYTNELKSRLIKNLKTVYNRGFWGGYYLGQQLGEWSNQYGSVATHKKVYIGKVTNYFSKINVAEILIETGTLQKNDTVLAIGPTTGVIELTIDEMRKDDKTITISEKGDRISIKTNTILRRSDKIYKWVET